MPKKYGLEIWAYCLMTNYIHFIAFPTHHDSLARTLASADTPYSQLINRRTRKGGHLWQGSFSPGVSTILSPSRVITGKDVFFEGRLAHPYQRQTQKEGRRGKIVSDPIYCHSLS